MAEHGVVKFVQLDQVRPSIEGVQVLGRGMTVTGPEGPVFTNVDLQVDAGTLSVAVGPAGSGRTSLLLALCGRLRLTAGYLNVSGHVLPDQAKSVRHLVAPARLRPSMELETRHRVRETIRERELINGLDERAIPRALDFLDLTVDRASLVGELPPVEQLLLAVALAIADQPAGIVVDDVEFGLPLAGQERAWTALRSVSRTGITVIASATIAPADSVVVALEGQKSPVTQPGVDT